MVGFEPVAVVGFWPMAGFEPVAVVGFWPMAGLEPVAVVGFCPMPGWSPLVVARCGAAGISCSNVGSIPSIESPLLKIRVLAVGLGFDAWAFCVLALFCGEGGVAFDATLLLVGATSVAV